MYLTDPRMTDFWQQKQKPRLSLATSNFVEFPKDILIQQFDAMTN